MRSLYSFVRLVTHVTSTEPMCDSDQRNKQTKNIKNQIKSQSKKKRLSEMTKLVVVESKCVLFCFRLPAPQVIGLLIHSSRGEDYDHAVGGRASGTAVSFCVVLGSG